MKKVVTKQELKIDVMDATPEISAGEVSIMFIVQFFEKWRKVLPEEKPITGTDKTLLFLKACRKVWSRPPAPLFPSILPGG